jgi:dipeptidyl-peptidase 4
MKKLFFILFLFPLGILGQLKELTLKDAVMLQGRSLAPDRINNFQWLPSSISYSFLSKNWQNLFLSDVKSKEDKEIAIIQDVNLACQTNFQGFIGLEWLNDKEFLLDNGTQILTYNYVTKTGKLLQSLPAKGENPKYHKGTNVLAYTLENNLFIRMTDGKEVPITGNKDPNIVTGQSVSRNEFGISEGIFWSPNGQLLAFYQKDESAVHDYPLLDINETPGKLTSIKYPMAGQPSEQVKLGVYNIQTQTTYFIRPVGGKEDYLTNIAFTPDNQFIILAEVNRDQNKSTVWLYNANNGERVRKLFEETSDKWVEPEHPAFFPSKTSNNFIWISERNGFNNLYQYDLNGKLLNQLTNHNFVVKDIIGTAQNGSFLYYKATGEKGINSMIYLYDFKKGTSTLLTTTEGTHNFSVSFDGQFYYDAYSNSTTAHLAQILGANGKQAKLLVNNPDKLNEYKIGKNEIGTLTANDGTALFYRIIRPSDFDENKKYPVMVYVYGGPHAQMVTNSWLNGANLWMHWMAEQGYIVFTLDNRGSAERGFAFESVIHRQLGTVEMEDQMTGVKFLKSLPYIDSTRLAVHGWSFGGFMTTSLMLRQPGTFKVGVAGGPVTDWKYYEIMYGERYMDRPEENKEGYEQSSLLNYAKNLKGDLLLIHGTIDDVVVMQHNYALVKKFVDLGIQMDFFPYPMHKHNVSGKDRVHLMEKILTYILEKN